MRFSREREIKTDAEALAIVYRRIFRDSYLLYGPFREGICPFWEKRTVFPRARLEPR